ncbi:MAG: glycosyltransferase [Bryobacterales bacterium]|nr:glycosyltransferase [Bryobacterales bacterium]
MLSPILFLLLALTYQAGRHRRADGRLDGEPLFQGDTRPPCTIVIPNWNGLDLLQRYLQSVIEACDFDLGDEIIIVDNASTDGSVAWLRATCLQARVLALDSNLGFGGGSNAGIQAATNPIVVLLNSDMRVDRDFLAPLIQPFREADVFAVAAQIQFSDSAKRREESGLTYARMRGGRLELGHQVESIPEGVQPCFYPGGGSSAFNRRMLIALGGFDHIFRPFYLEDTDLGFEAWRRGWRVVFQPASVVFHEHRGTIGKHFTPGYINSIVAKNRLLFQWKHLHSTWPVVQSIAGVTADILNSCFVSADADHRVTSAALFHALKQLPETLASRYGSARHARRADTEALALHQPDVYFDHYGSPVPVDRKLRVLFVSPYPLYPPRHGGAVLITQSLDYMRAYCEVHLVVVLEEEAEREAHQQYAADFASLHLIVRRPASSCGRLGLHPKASREFDLPELRQLLPRLIHDCQIDVLQLEYTQMAQYARRYQRILTALFEHDVYFQTVGRRIFTRGAASGAKTILEYFRALRFELKAVQQMDYIQVCTQDNAQLLRAYLPHMDSRIDANLRAGIQLSAYPFSPSARLPATLLFVGNFRHTPNREGLRWLIDHVMPAVVATDPEIRLRIVGANCDQIALPMPTPNWLDVVGEVAQVQPYLNECTLFVCPVLTGSGVRVKLLEAYASGTPVVSTSVGAEGLSENDGPLCALGDSPAAFASAILQLLKNPDEAAKLARKAREFVEANWDAEANARRVEQRYRELLAIKLQKLRER